MKKKLLYALLSLVIAFGVWMYVITVVSPESEETYYDVEVALINSTVLKEDKGLMLTTTEKPKVTLRLKGNRTDLNKLNKSDITLVADLAKINEPGQQSLTYTISFPGNFGDNAFEIISYSPDRITLDVVEWADKWVDVIVTPTGSPAADYIVAQDGITQDKDQIYIYGPKTIVDQIHHAKLDVSVAGKTATVSVSQKPTMCDAEGKPVNATGVTADVAEINASVQIQKVKTLQLTLNVTYGGGATKDNTKIDLSYASIKVAGSERLLESLGDTLEIGTLNVAELKDDAKEFTFVIPIPDGVDNLSGVTEVTATVSFPDLKTKKISLPVSSNMVYNMPSGMTVAELGTLRCEVTFRGPTALINRLSEENVVIRIDLSGAALGEGMYKAQIQITDPALSDIGVVGTYNISIRLVAEPTTTTP